MQLDQLPVPPEADNDDGGDSETALVTVSILDDDGTYRAANINLDDPTDDDIANAIMACMRGVASMCGPKTQLALLRALETNR